MTTAGIYIKISATITEKGKKSEVVEEDMTLHLESIGISGVSLQTYDVLLISSCSPLSQFYYNYLCSPRWKTHNTLILDKAH